MALPSVARLRMSPRKFGTATQRSVARNIGDARVRPRVLERVQRVPEELDLVGQIGAGVLESILGPMLRRRTPGLDRARRGRSRYPSGRREVILAHGTGHPGIVSHAGVVE